MVPRRLVAVGLVATSVLAAGVSVTPPATAVATSTPGTIAAARLARMTEAQRVGQLFMVGTPATGASSATLTAIARYHVGNVILTGRSYAGVAAVARVSATLRARATATATNAVPLFVATDQEGGYVQVLHGPGFSTIPTALIQGGWSTTYLRAAATTWGRQLRAAGVNVDLAPVTDTVPSAAFAPYNAPIGYYKREFGFTTARVAAHGVAFAQGMAAAHVEATAKHFPGLGRVTANTDVASGVTDRITTRHDAYVAPFAAAVNAGVPFVMMSTAFYSRIDPTHPAAFSRTVIGGMLRGDLRFTGVVISDDLGAARQVAAYSLGSRAVDFITAGGDMVLTVTPATLPAMYAAVLHAATTNATWRARVNQSALRVLTAKARLGLIR